MNSLPIFLAENAAGWPAAFAIVGTPLAVLLGFAALAWACNR